MAKLTPMMKQYFEIKDNYKDYILFFRLGDFYEMFFDDAVTASRELELTLTGRNCGLEEKAPLCGVPYHSASGYIQKMVAKGYKVAICEQVEDPATAKGIVKREVIRVITPGTIIDPEMLDDKTNNYILSIIEEGDTFALSYADISTGEFYTTDFIKGDFLTVSNEIIKINPKEVIMQEGKVYPKEIQIVLDSYEKLMISKLESNYYSESFSLDVLTRNFKVSSIDALGLDSSKLSLISSGMLMGYIEETQKVNLVHFDKVEYYSHSNYMIIDKFTSKNLELVETIRGKEKKGSLLWVMDKTSTAMGARELRHWIKEPLLNPKLIKLRQDAVENLFDDFLLREELKENLKGIYDLERLCSKLVYNNANPRDLMALCNSLDKVPHIKTVLSNSSSDYLTELDSKIDPLEDVTEIIRSSINEEPPMLIREGGIIKDGYNSELDELRTIVRDGKGWILGIEQEEKEKTGIKNLKIGFNKVFGYYIEVTKSNLGLVPEEYIRKQTLANAERYIMPKLKEMESKVLGAEEKINSLEYSLFNSIREDLLNHVSRIKGTAKSLSVVDVLTSLSEVAYKNNYVKPEINDSHEVSITEGRHPVVEKITGLEDFVPNDSYLNNDEDTFSIITGPNMAGKSTYLRQVALITLLGQIGSFVPAREAKIGIVDRIFTRVGASDDLSQGQSTFMVEMSELANILKNTSNNSLIILDEIGRGTSTYDGLSIAWSVVEYLSKFNNTGVKTLFATHYHELTELEGKIKGVKNYRISVEEIGDDIVFLRKIVRGGANQSYGIQVAQLAGVPDDVIKRAKEILTTLEINDINKSDKKVDITIAECIKEKEEDKDEVQLSLFDDSSDEIIKELKSLNVYEMTPMDAMNYLFELVKKID
ncbi:MAG: DNA mismatch repair protein MutS [Firmicutes bacterium]|jgi:DNA mismatch repair protein MutS|nr:DNA mismatch repair protein MutS [Bacillota bacterium]